MKRLACWLFGHGENLLHVWGYRIHSLSCLRCGTELACRRCYSEGMVVWASTVKRP